MTDKIHFCISIPQVRLFKDEFGTEIDRKHIVNRLKLITAHVENENCQGIEITFTGDFLAVSQTVYGPPKPEF